ncbi:MAG: TIGR02679 domain-containing protein, partial [Bacilli bacterium]
MMYVNYFKDNKGFKRMLLKLKEKYIKTGKFAGSIILDNITSEESKDLSCFLGVNYLVGQTVTISLKNIKLIMNKSKYNDFDFKILLDNYFCDEITTNQQICSYQKKEKELFFESILANADYVAYEWLNTVFLNKKDDYRLIVKRYNQNKDILKNDLLKIVKCLNNLPSFNNMTKYLPIFACEWAKDPHFLDINSKNSNLFIYGLCHVLKKEYPKSRTKKIELYFNAGIVADPISNYAITYNLKIDNDNVFVNQPLILNLYNLTKISNVDSASKK